MESTPAQSAEGMAIVRVLAAVLDRLVGANAPLARADPGQVTKFHALKAPRIGILQYLERIHKYASCSAECFILALIYIDRLIQRNNFLLTELNVHRVVITSVLLAAKFFDDAYYNNAYYAKVGGVLVSEMNSLEVEFLFRINFSLHVSPDLYGKYHAELISHATGTTSVSGIMSAALGAAPTLPAGVFVNSNPMASTLINDMRSLSKPIIAGQQSLPCQTGYAGVHRHAVNRYKAAEMPSQITPSPPQTASFAPPLTAYSSVMVHHNQVNDPLHREDISEKIYRQQLAAELEKREAMASCQLSAGYDAIMQHGLGNHVDARYHDDKSHHLTLPMDFSVAGIHNIYQMPPAPTSNATITSCTQNIAPVDYSTNLISGTNHHNPIVPPYHVPNLPQVHHQSSAACNNHASRPMLYGSRLAPAGGITVSQSHYPYHTNASVVAACSGI